MAERRSVRLRCYAKVNLTLEVLGRRSDGFHDLASVVRTVSLADDLEVAESEALTLRLEGLGLPPEENLVLRAAELLARSRLLGADMLLRKRIPVAAGLGGGSSDAAAALVALNRIWATGLDRRRLAELAARLGSDVPFFLRGGAAVLRGRGDAVEPLARARPQWLVLVVASHAVESKTATLYRALTPEDFSGASATEGLAARLSRGEPVRDADLVNAFERPARSAFEGLGALWDDLQRATGRRFHLSGAGPSIFALASDRHDAGALARQLSADLKQVYVVRTVERGHRRQPVPAN